MVDGVNGGCQAPAVPTELDREQGLVRAIGVRGLTASIVNSTVGAGIFVLPALVARDLGSAAPLAYPRAPWR